MHLAVVVVVNSLTLTHCQGLDLEYTSVTDCRNRLIRGSLIIARFSAVGMGVGLYAGRLIREYIQYAVTYAAAAAAAAAASLLQCSKSRDPLDLLVKLCLHRKLRPALHCLAC